MTNPVYACKHAIRVDLRGSGQALTIFHEPITPPDDRGRLESGPDRHFERLGASGVNTGPVCACLSAINLGMETA